METITVTAPLHGTVMSIDVGEGRPVPEGAPLRVLESMKMEHAVTTPVGGVAQDIATAVGELVAEGQVLLSVTAGAVEPAVATKGATEEDRPSLAEAVRRHEIGLDAARPDAVRRWHATGRRTARENIVDLCETSTEYGALALAAQRRRPLDELIEKTPADGLVDGVGEVNGRPAVVMPYDDMVLAGTQGMMNHYKKDRMFELAERRRLPVVLFVEGGGGRPGDSDTTSISGFDCMAFTLFARLSGMGLEGAVRLGYRREPAAAEDPEALFDELVARSYEQGKALSAATVYEIDDVIDPERTRHWIATAFRDVPRGPRRMPLDTW